MVERRIKHTTTPPEPNTQTPASKAPRRSPVPGERIRDAETSRRGLLAAALEEFAARGYAGARVQDIADRAGVNKQLINYYFGGKEGLYRGVQKMWEPPVESADPDLPLGDLAVRYLRSTLADPRLIRLLLWRGLGGDEDDAPPSSRGFGLEGMTRRKERGEIPADLDPRAVMLILLGAVSIPVCMPERVETITGMKPDSAEFADFYAEQLRAIVGHLSGG